MEEKFFAEDGEDISAKERMLAVMLEQSARGVLHVVQFAVELYDLVVYIKQWSRLTNG